MFLSNVHEPSVIPYEERWFPCSFGNHNHASDRVKSTEQESTWYHQMLRNTEATFLAIFTSKKFKNFKNVLFST